MVAWRWAFIDDFGVNVPFWDQWGAEGAWLYAPWLRGEFEWQTLFAPHNEHRILTSRVVDLLLFHGNGVWNTRLQMAANALVHASAVTLLCYALGRALTAPSRIAIAIGGIALIAHPLGWENSLCGFQLQMYLTILFQIAALLLLLTRPLFGPGWWTALPLIALAFFSLSAGIAAAVVGVAMLLLEAARLRRLGGSEAAAVALLGAIAFAGVWLTPALPHHAELRAHSLLEVLQTAGSGLAWPWPEYPWMAPWMHAPWLLVALRSLRAPAPSSGRLLIALGAWVLLQAAIVGIGRGADGAMPSSRHFDLMALGALVNVACLLHLLESARPFDVGSRRKIALASLWCLHLAVGFVRIAPDDWEDAQRRRHLSRVHGETLRAFVASGDEAVLLEAEPMLELPVPDAADLLNALRNDSYLAALPRWLRAPLPGASDRHGWKRPDGPLSEAAEALMDLDWLIGALGGGMLLTTLARIRRDHSELGELGELEQRA